MLDIVTIGKAMRDIILQIDETLTEDSSKHEKVMVKESYLSVGGGAANTAVGLVKLGYKVAPTAVIANDPEGKEIKDHLERRGVETELLIDNDSLSTGTSVIIEGSKREHKAYIYPGANKFLDLDMIQWKTIKDARCWYLLSVGNSDPALLKDIADHKARYDVRLAFNPGQMQLKLDKKQLAPILQATDILIVNQREAEQLTDVKGDEVFKALVGLGPKIAVVTSGADGASCYGGKEILKASAYPTDNINSLGAGDAFGSGFLAGFLKTGKLDIALKWGLVNSASVVKQYGAQKGLLTKGEILKQLDTKDLKVEKIS